MSNLTPENLRSLLIQLQEISNEVVVVGGQAVNLWANFYRERVAALNNYLPFASEDLDFYGGRLEALTCHQILGGEIYLSEAFDPSPNAGVIIINYQNRTFRIDFLNSVYGLSEAEIVNTAIAFTGINSLLGVNLKVLHPLLCLEGKLKCLKGLPQEGRQDFKHVQMSLLCLNQFLNDLLQQLQIRPFLKLAERLITSTLSETGLYAWYHYDIFLEQAIPIEQGETFFSNQQHSEAERLKWQQFSTIRFPLFLQQLSAKRDRYQSLMERIQAQQKRE